MDTISTNPACVENHSNGHSLESSQIFQEQNTVVPDNIFYTCKKGKIWNTNTTKSNLNKNLT